MQRLSAKSERRTIRGWVAAKASELGFDLCGVIPAAELAPPEHLAEWLEQGFAGEMRYLHDPRRADPAGVMPEARSAIVCAINYNPPAPYSTEAAAAAALHEGGARGWISRYAWGKDYHLIVGERLEAFVAVLREKFGAQFGAQLGAQVGESFAARAYVDTGPISERMAAKLAGLGWLGKNTCLINRELGSWLFLGVILTSIDLVSAGDPSAPSAAQSDSAAAARSPADLSPELSPDLCGNCRLCLDACPTGALVEEYVLDARRCISYLTIELRGAIPEELRTGIGWQVFGCDICQDVCPWNRKAPIAALPAFAEQNSVPLQSPELLWLLSLTEQEFRDAFRHSAVRRAKWRGLIRNACVAAGNALRRLSGRSPKQVPPEGPQHAALVARLAQLAASEDALIAEHARWALAQQSPAPLQKSGAAENAALPRDASTG